MSPIKEVVAQIVQNQEIKKEELMKFQLLCKVKPTKKLEILMKVKIVMKSQFYSKEKLL